MKRGVSNAVRWLGKEIKRLFITQDQGGGNLHLITKQFVGGECAKCGYSKSQRVLEFHHVNPEEKEVPLSDLISRGVPHEIICLELDKCIMLCKNCHAEFEGGVWSCEFEKVKLGYKIKDDSIIEYQENCWYEVSDKILYGQASLLG